MLLSTNMIRVHDAFGVEGMFSTLAKCGFQGIDFNNDMPGYFTDEHDATFYEALGNFARSNGIVISQAHAPFPSSYVEEDKSAKRFEEIVQSMKNAAHLGAPMIVVHPCTHLDYKVESNQEVIFEYNLAFYRALIPYAREFGIQIAIENIGGVSVTSAPERLNRLIDTLNDPVFTICYDVGHALLQKVDPAEAIRTLGHRLAKGCTHIHDNRGDADSHTLPFYGNVKWDSVMQALADIDYKGNLSYEAAAFIGGIPRDLYLDGLIYMAKVGHYLISRFEYHKANRI